MTVDGVTVVRVIAPTREQQLERELADCYASLELKQCQLEDACAQLAANGAPAAAPDDVVCVGGGLIGESEGWLWLVRDGAVRRLWPASADEIKHGAAIRAQVAREQAERRRFAS
jgi:hypothetical protein